MAGSIQFFGRDAALSAFENSGADVWSFWQGGQLLCKGKGSEMLASFIDAIIEGGASNAIYTVKIYEDVDDPKKVKNNTPIDGSFNFRLNAPEMSMSGQSMTRYSNYSALNQKIEELEKKLEGKEEDDDEEEKTIGKVIGDVVIDAIQDPSKMMMWIDMFKNLFGNKTAASSPAPIRSIPYAPPAKVGNIQDPPAGQELSQDQMQRVAAALDVLEKKDDRIADHLEKLARMAENNPQQFKFILSMLDTMKV